MVPNGSIAVSQGLGTSSGASTLDKLNLPPQTGDQGQENPPAKARETMAKRGRAKRATLELVNQLVELDSPVPYDRAYSCCARVDDDGRELTSHYCNSRWCVVCGRIRCGRHVNNQLPVVRTWEDPHLVTLTLPNIPWGGGAKAAGRLRSTYEEMLRRFNLAKRSINRTHGLDFRALRGFEVTWNGDEGGSLHPHFHVVVPNREIAQALREEWLKRCSNAARSAQDVCPIEDPEEGLVEVCKYVCKIIGGEKGRPAYPVEVLDAIFRGLKGKKLLQSVGYSPVEFGGEDEKKVEEGEGLERRVCSFTDTRPGEEAAWHWEPSMGDWINRQTGEMLTGYGYRARAGPG